MSITTQQIINIGRACKIYAGNGLRNGQRHGGTNDTGLPNMIFYVGKGLEYLYDLDSDNEDIGNLENFLIAICKDAPRAEAAIVGGGGLPTLITPTSPAPLDWVVSASSIPLATGESLATLSTFIRYQINFSRGGIIQSTTDPGGGGTYYSWNSTTGAFALINGAAQVDEPMRIFI